MDRSTARLRQALGLLSLCAVAFGGIGCAAPPKETERGREIERISKGGAGFISAPLTQMGWWITDTTDNLTGDTPGKYARLMESNEPDLRRIGINWLAEKPYGEKPPFTTRYAQIAKNDTDFLVRATAIRALNRSRDKSATALFIQALADPNEQVRLEAAKALNHVPDPAAVDPLLALLRKGEEGKDLRIAAADALRHYKKLEVARGLASMLGERDFGLAWQSHRSLKLLTGKDLRYDEGAWLAFLTGPEKPLG